MVHHLLEKNNWMGESCKWWIEKLWSFVGDAILITEWNVKGMAIFICMSMEQRKNWHPPKYSRITCKTLYFAARCATFEF